MLKKEKSVCVIWNANVTLMRGMNQSKRNFDIDFEELTEVSRALVDSFFIGMSAIAQAYPENLRITGEP